MTRILLALSLTLAGSGVGRAAEAETAGGPYCGIYSVYAALTSLGVEVPFESLTRPQYVGGFLGSSLEELRLAVVDHGGHAVPVAGLTATALRNSPIPVILHVRRPGYRSGFAHWVAYMGCDGEQARVIDPPRGVETMSFAELLSLWDGTGLAVSRAPVGWELWAWAWAEHLVIVLLAVGLVLALKVVAPKPRQALLRYGLLLGLPAAAGLAAHATHELGALRSPVAVAQVVGMHFKPPLEELDTDGLRERMARPNVRLIDSRFPAAFRAGHLPGAQNLPVYTGMVERSRALEGLDPAAPVVVYCQGENCEWADVLASDLSLRGFRDVAVYRGGFNEWRRERAVPKTP